VLSAPAPAIEATLQLRFVAKSGLSPAGVLIRSRQPS
jgi:hypothetical protein